MATKKTAKKASRKFTAKKAPAKKAAGKKPSTQKAAAKKSSSSHKSPSSQAGSKKAGSSRSSARKYSPAAGKQVETEMHEMHEGKLKIGTRKKKVTNPKQAIAIGLSEARRKGARVPPNPNK